MASSDNDFLIVKIPGFNSDYCFVICPKNNIWLKTLDFLVVDGGMKKKKKEKNCFATSQRTFVFVR